ncbi:MAG: DNA-binding protein [Hadesarchaea archaeon]|nr:DNA-binding protein [Hadesarchaea archaeon]
MKAKEVRPAMRNIDLELRIVEKSEPRTYISRQGREGRVATAVGEDDSGQIKVSLWDDDIDRVNVGDLIRIQNGYSRLFRDEVHVSAGMYGKLEVIKKGEEG